MNVTIKNGLLYQLLIYYDSDSDFLSRTLE